MRTKVLAALTLCLLGCYRPDIRTIAVSVPQMKSPDCIRVIQNVLGTVDGIVSVQPDIQNHIVSVTYDSTKLGIKNVEYVIASAGFDANDARGMPEERAKLPEPCR